MECFRLQSALTLAKKECPLHLIVAIHVSVFVSLRLFPFQPTIFMYFISLNIPLMCDTDLSSLYGNLLHRSSVLLPGIVTATSLWLRSPKGEESVSPSA